MSSRLPLKRGQFYLVKVPTLAEDDTYLPMQATRVTKTEADLQGYDDLMALYKYEGDWVVTNGALYVFLKPSTCARFLSYQKKRLAAEPRSV
ncbi:hypothetical protein WJX72_007438 [[Myrmecia] bisecta]|uniref:Uncharacterized protein n=1 Tax=[Myrmecia] bisecta TaxID=41462 RepID=A0AAW1R7C9_9CHLO